MFLEFIFMQGDKGAEFQDDSHSELTVNLTSAGTDIEEIYKTMSSDVFNSLRKNESVEDLKEAFTGTAAIDWMEDNLFLKSREQAIPIGTEMLHKSFLHQISTETMKPLPPADSAFVDSGSVFYIFPSLSDVNISGDSIDSGEFGRKRKRGRVGGGLSVTNYAEVFEALRDPGNGLPLSDNKARKFPFLSSEVCEASFRGSEAVNWMLINLPFRTRSEAASFCTTLLQQGFILPATSKAKPRDNKHNLSKETFKDSSDSLYQLSVSINSKKQCKLTTVIGTS